MKIVHVALTLQLEYLERKAKDGEARGKRLQPARVKQKVCQYFGIGFDTYAKVMAAYCNGESAYDGGGTRGNWRAKTKRIPMTNKVRRLIREFVNLQRANRTRVTARQVLELLVREKLLGIPRNADGNFEKQQFATAYRNVRRLLQRLGYRRGKRSGNIALKAHVAAHRDEYLEEYFKLRSLPVNEQYREVYLDESYIHHHYHRFDDSIYDPNDEQDIQVGKAPGKGRRYCFLAAIQGPDPMLSNDRLLLPEEVSQDRKPGLVPGSYWRFCPQKKAQTGDYHKAFNGENFIKWWKEKLLPNLHQKSLIIMDNASYHKTYASHVPKPQKMKKAECIQFLAGHGVQLTGSEGAVAAKSMVRSYIKNCIKYEATELAEAQGHRVLFTPPHHSDLQPIELVWAHIKGNIGRKYDANTRLELVLQRLDHEFDTLSKDNGQHSEVGNTIIGSIIAKTIRISQRFHEKFVVNSPDSAADDAGSSTDESSESSIDSDGDSSVVSDSESQEDDET